MWQANCRRMQNFADWISGTVMGGIKYMDKLRKETKNMEAFQSLALLEQIGLDFVGRTIASGRNEPLKKDCPKWKSEYPMTEGQLRSKRDEFSDTAPAFEGRKEIWDALKAAALATECNDLELEQAIVDGAYVTLPHGSLTESYDELGNHYQLPAYALAPPLNLITEATSESDISVHTDKQNSSTPLKQEFQLQVRLSTGKDLCLTASMTDSILELKKQLEGQEDIEVAHQRWFFSRKLLTDKTQLQDTKIQKDFVVQVIVNPNILVLVN